MKVDPLASMRCWAIELELGGRTFDVPALPAVDWWPVLATGDLTQILDFVTSTPDDPFDLDDLLLTGELDRDNLTEALVDAVEEVAGRSFHSAAILAQVAQMHWVSINGSLVRRGFRWEDQPLGAALDAIYAEVTSRLDKDELTKFLAVLENESLTKPGKRRARAREQAMSEFESLAGPRPTTGVVATAERSGSARPKTRPRLQQRRRGGPSGAPRTPPAGRAGNGRAASSGSPPDGAGPASA